MTMYVAFPECIWHVVANGELILLDATRNQFLLFSKEATGEILKAIKGSLPPELVVNFIDQAILVRRKVPQIINHSYARGLDDFTWSESMRYKTKHYAYKPSSSELLLAFTALIGAFITIKTRRLSSILASNSRSMIAQQELSDEVIGREIKSLVHAARLFPSKIACLEFSVALRYRLAKRGAYSSLVIGVQKYSFMAHAWLELGKV